MTLIRLLPRALSLAVAIASFAAALSAQDAAPNAPNTTGLPTYPHLTKGTEYPSVNEDSGTFRVYTAGSPDAIAVVEAWYRHALPKAVETKDDNSVTHGIVLTVGKDKVLVYNLMGSKETVVELQKHL